MLVFSHHFPMKWTTPRGHTKTTEGYRNEENGPMNSENQIQPNIPLASQDEQTTTSTGNNDTKLNQSRRKSKCVTYKQKNSMANKDRIASNTHIKVLSSTTIYSFVSELQRIEYFFYIPMQ